MKTCLLRGAWAALAALSLALPLSPAWASEAEPAQRKALHALFDRHWDWSTQASPEFASYRGDHRFGDRLSDVSQAAQDEREQTIRRFAEQARALQVDRLGSTDRLSLALFIDMQQRQLEQAAFPGARGMSLRALGGPQTKFAELLQIMPMQSAAQVEQMLSRMAAYPRRMEQEIAQLRRSAALGWVPARPVLERVLAQIDAQLLAPEAAPHYQPFKRLGQGIAPDQAQALRERGLQAVATQVLPALRQLRALVSDELMAKAPADGALRNYPDGAKVYAMAVRHRTSTDMTPAQIHAIGLRELARLRSEMEAVMKETRFDGSFERFVEFINTDERFFHKGPEALLAGYRDIAKRLDAEMPRLFAELPRAPYGIRSMPAHMGANRAESYNGPAIDGSRAGFFFANTLAWRSRPIWGMETLVAHETMPGHHMQVARATELLGLPNFRRSGFGYTAFSEGWALYAETLGTELGLFTDPYSKFGHLQWQAFRAARLVVDTGIHELGWSRQRAIDFMVERTGTGREFVASEVDRYASDPAQALAYMIGKLKFDELRDRAKAGLGARFDIRRFHNAVLDNGAVSLSALERLIDDWILAQAGAPG